MGLDLFVAFWPLKLGRSNHGTLWPSRHPLGLLWLTTLPTGDTNSVQILQGDILFIIQDEMPDIAAAFMDDVNVRGPPTQYETRSTGWYISTAFCRHPATVCSHYLRPYSRPATPQLGWSTLRGYPQRTLDLSVHLEHLNDINRVLPVCQESRRNLLRMENGRLCPRSCSCGHRCTYEGQYPEDWKVQKILDWPDCNTLMEVHGFLGVCGVVQIWVKDFAMCARPLVILTKKEVDFSWGPEQKDSMEDLKQADHYSPMSSANRLSFQLMCYPGSWLFLVLPQASFSFSLGWTISITLADLVLLLGTRGNPATVRLKSKSMVSGMLSKHIGSTLSVSKIFEWKLTRVISKAC